MTHIFMVSVHHRHRCRFRPALLHALMMSRRRPGEDISISCHSHRFVLVPTISCQPLSFEISGSTLTLTSWCEPIQPMSQRLCQPVLQCCINYGASVSHCWGPFSSCSCRHLFCLDWTSATRPLLTSQHIFFSGSNPWWMQLLGWFFHCQNSTTSLRFFVNSIGWRFVNGLTSNSPFSYTNACMGWHCRTSSTNSADQLILRLDSDCARPRLHHWLSAELDSTIGDLAFPVAAARVWNNLPQQITSAPSLHVFASRLKTHFFSVSFPEQFWMYSACEVTSSLLDTLNQSSYLLYIPLAIRQ